MPDRPSQRSAGIFLALLLILTMVVSCNRRVRKSQIDPNAYAKEIEQWHQERWKELNSESGWLTLVGLFWLKEGVNGCGSAPDMEIVLLHDKVPSVLGSFSVTGAKIEFIPAVQGFTVEGK